MSRLTQALERAQVGAGGEPPVPPAEERQSEAAPSVWRLDQSRADPERSTVRIEDRVPTEYKDKVVVGEKADRALIEQYRQLAALLHRVQQRDGARSVMIASAVAGEGKTLTATNLALTLSQSYQRRVLLIDADLRGPSIHRMFQLSNGTGLGDVVKAPRGKGVLPIQWLSPTLAVLTGGHPDSDPMSGLVSRAMKQLLTEATEQFDWVVVDTPPVALMSDAKLLAAMIDTTLVVVSASTTPYLLVKRAIDAVGAKVLGVVLNRVAKSEVAGGSGYYGYGYDYRRRLKREKK